MHHMTVPHPDGAIPTSANYTSGMALHPTSTLPLGGNKGQYAQFVADCLKMAGDLSCTIFTGTAKTVSMRVACEPSYVTGATFLKATCSHCGGEVDGRGFFA